MKKIIALFTSFLIAVSLLAGCGSGGNSETGSTAGNTQTEAAESSEAAEETTEESTKEEIPAPENGDFDEALKLDRIEWTLGETGTYWYATLSYCADNEIPEELREMYQIMNIYVPLYYLNEDGSIDTRAKVRTYTAESAPIIFKNNCTGWNSSTPQEANEEWLKEGWIQVECGARSRNADEGDLYGKAPAAVVDLKSGLRMLRLNNELIPGSMDNIISYGFSGGGQMSSMVGATGNMDEYYRMLWENGAAGVCKLDDGLYASTIDDSVYGCMCFCPIATLQAASCAQAWMRYDSAVNGGYAFTPFQQQLEKDMAVKFCEYINELGLVNDAGEVLSFDIDSKTGKPDPRKGSYYDQTLANMSAALNAFATTEGIFPYTVRIGMGPSATYTEYPTFDDLLAKYVADGNGFVQNGTGEWIGVDGDGVYSVTDFAGFFHGTGLTRFKGIPAFDGLYWDDANGTYGDGAGRTTENDAFGEPGQAAVHYSAMIGELLKENYQTYSALEGFDSETVDRYIEESLNEDLQEQLYLVDSMQIMLDTANGEQESDIAPQWRMRMGTADQNSFAIAYDFCMAAQMAGADMDYHLVWAMPHGIDEGTSTGTFVDWVNEISR